MSADEIIAKLKRELSIPARPSPDILPDISQLPYIIEHDENGQDNLPKQQG